MWTYFVQSVDGGPIKIGFTEGEPSVRLSGLQTGSPVKLQIIGLLYGNREREMHERFKEFRVHREWFEPKKPLLEFIKTECTSSMIPKTNANLVFKNKGFCEKSIHEFLFTDKSRFTDDLLACYDWECINEDEEDADDEEHDEYSVILNMGLIASEGTLVDFIGVTHQKEGGGWIGFHCNPCNSHVRRNALEDLAHWAFEMDFLTGDWFLFAIVPQGGSLIGINLTLYGAALWGVPYTKDSWEFDPKVAFNKSDQLIGTP